MQDMHDQPPSSDSQSCSWHSEHTAAAVASAVSKRKTRDLDMRQAHQHESSAPSRLESSTAVGRAAVHRGTRGSAWCLTRRVRQPPTDTVRRQRSRMSRPWSLCSSLVLSRRFSSCVTDSVGDVSRVDARDELPAASNCKTFNVHQHRRLDQENRPLEMESWNRRSRKHMSHVWPRRSQCTKMLNASPFAKTAGQMATNDEHFC